MFIDFVKGSNHSEEISEENINIEQHNQAQSMLVDATEESRSKMGIIQLVHWLKQEKYKMTKIVWLKRLTIFF